MVTLTSVTDPGVCRDLWERYIPQEHITDHWEVRECFREAFGSELLFLHVTENNQPVGLLPLCYVPERDYYAYFPGEHWQGKTWLERNRLPVRDADIARALLDWCEERRIDYHLRYLLPDDRLEKGGPLVDEIGYLFRPADFDYDMDRYFSGFSRKSIKSILKEVRAFEARGLEYRLDDFSDFDLLVELNRERFGQTSYFADPRFTDGMEKLTELMRARGWLRMVTVLVEGRAAAVDMGCLYNGTLTLLAGGTSADFRGIAKVINLYHMRRACEERLEEVDFLCGDFLWKPMFHLHPRPLYQLSNRPDLIHKG
ncbi:MAG: GNAT family N-acetyltransferase [Candidatus Omnitrophica bacterium]|nr:GNAT family N-acetyltransferase [Candidatus Omnitrophota bacterium]MCB9720204.1 GNAT family N-acetyltransferase [Candidatus Omnitrophota bacterium]